MFVVPRSASCSSGTPSRSPSTKPSPSTSTRPVGGERPAALRHDEHHHLRLPAGAQHEHEMSVLARSDCPGTRRVRGTAWYVCAGRRSSAGTSCAGSATTTDPDFHPDDHDATELVKLGTPFGAEGSLTPRAHGVSGRTLDTRERDGGRARLHRASAATTEGGSRPLGVISSRASSDVRLTSMPRSPPPRHVPRFSPRVEALP